MTFAKEKEMRAPVVAWLAEAGWLTAVEFHLWHAVDIVAGQYGERPAKGRKPPLLQTLAIELKLHDIAGVISQAKRNRACVHASWCAMPFAATNKMRPATMQKFRDAGVGLMAVAVDFVLPVFWPTLDTRFREFHKPRADRLWSRVRSQYREVQL